MARITGKWMSTGPRPTKSPPRERRASSRRGPYHHRQSLPPADRRRLRQPRRWLDLHDERKHLPGELRRRQRQRSHPHGCAVNGLRVIVKESEKDCSRVSVRRAIGYPEPRRRRRTSQAISDGAEKAPPCLKKEPCHELRASRPRIGLTGKAEERSLPATRILRKSKA